MPPPKLARLVRAAARIGPRLALAPGAELPLGRAHEVCGPARLVFAALVAAQAGEGPVLWIRGPQAEGRLNPDGLAPFLNPGRLTLAAPSRAADVLWCAEEALRSGAASLVVAEPAAPPRLTPVRRLHLAAEAGAEMAEAPPLMLLLTPGDGGAEGVETRWRMAPAPSRAWAGAGAAGGGLPAPAWRLELLRARHARPRRWTARFEDGRLTLGPDETAAGAEAAPQPGAGARGRLAGGMPAA